MNEMKAMRVMNVRAQQGISSRRHTTRMMAAQQGTLMRSFTLPSTKGGNTKVPAKNGSVVFFFNKSDTPGCKAEADTFDELYGEFKKKGIQVVGISMEDVDALKKSNEGRKVELLSDADGAVSEQFDSELKIPLIGAKLGFSARNTFLLSNKGEVLSVWQEGKSMGNVKNGKHAQQVLDSVEENIKSSNPLAVLFS